MVTTPYGPASAACGVHSLTFDRTVLPSDASLDRSPIRMMTITDGANEIVVFDLVGIAGEQIRCVGGMCIRVEDTRGNPVDGTTVTVGGFGATVTGGELVVSDVACGTTAVELLDVPGLVPLSPSRVTVRVTSRDVSDVVFVVRAEVQGVGTGAPGDRMYVT